MSDSSHSNENTQGFILNLDNIKAESFLTSTMESLEDTILEFQGVFSRNYYNDIIGLEQEEVIDKSLLYIKLSRDSLFHILPEGLFFRENDLRNVAKENNPEKFKALEEKIRREKQTILTLLYPFDKTYFTLRFELEQKLNELAQNKTSLLIDKLFDIYQIDNKNDLIKKVIPLLPLASEIRSNKMIWRDIFKSIFYPANVVVRIAEKQNDAGIMKQIVKTTLYIEKLTNREFKKLIKDLDVFAAFFYEWFLPVDMGYEFKIKDINEQFVLGGEMTLDYNTQLRIENYEL